MKRLAPLLILGFGFLLSACVAPVEVTRNAPLELTPEAEVSDRATHGDRQPLLRGTTSPVARVAPPDGSQVAAVAPSAGRVVPRGRVRMIANDNGGDLVDYVRRVSRARNQNTQIVLSGQCGSACTLYLSLEPSQTCITRGTSFVFHRAYGATADMNQWGTDYLMARYPDWVQSWISARGGLSDRLMRMNYAYASRFMRTCRTTRA